jgi:hypothetical protein
MAAVSGESTQIDWSVRTRWLFVDHGVALTTIDLPAGFALRRGDRTLLNPAAIFPIQSCRVEAEMPFKSQAQRRKFAQLLVEGKISNETFEEWNRETGRKKLPERAPRKASAREKPQTKRRTRTTSKRRT